MAEEYLENPRRAPRVRILCAAALSTGSGAPLRASSEDLGPHGCQLVSPQPFAKGTPLRVELASQEIREVLRASGAVAWCSPHPPWRMGLAFADADRPAATRFFDRLVAARPGLANWRRVPDKLSLDAMVWLAPPPTRLVDFTADELVMLRAVGSGATIYEVRARLQDRWPTGQRAFFSLLTSGSITLSRGASAPYQNWLELLERLEAELGPAPARPPPAAPMAPPRPAAVAPPPAPAPPSAGPRPPARPAPTIPVSAAVAPPPPAASPERRVAEVRNDGSAGLDRELDLEALGDAGIEGGPLELEEVVPLEAVPMEALPLEIVGEDALDDQRDWPAGPASPAPPVDPLAPWPEPPPGKPRGQA